MSNYHYNTFNNQHKEFFIKFMEWYWKSMQNTDPNFIIGFRSDISISDYEFIYTLWRNGVDSYDEPMQKRLNEIREKYIANN